MASDNTYKKDLNSEEYSKIKTEADIKSEGKHGCFINNILYNEEENHMSVL